MNVSSLLVRFWPLIKPLVIKSLATVLRRLGEEAKTSQLHTAFLPFAEDLDAICDVVADALEGKTATPTAAVVKTA